MSNIARVIEAVERLHGDTRAQRRAHESYTTWLLRLRSQSLGGVCVIKTQADEEKR